MGSFVLKIISMIFGKFEIEKDQIGASQKQSVKA
jgi:hypothetical protein